MKLFGRALTIGSLFLFWFSSAFAEDRILDLSSGCKVFQLKGKNWRAVNATGFSGMAVPQSSIVKDAEFTAFKTDAGILGVNRRCLVASAVPIRSAEPAPVRGDLRTPWSAIFSLGYNLGPTGDVEVTYLGVTEKGKAKYKSSITFLGEANYRFTRTFRGAFELGLSQLQIDSQTGNETSFLDIRPEFVLPVSEKIEVYIGPMLGIFFLSQNTEVRTLSGANIGTEIRMKQQNASTALIGLGLGADLALNSQFDLGLYFRYFLPGTLEVTGTEQFPQPGNPYVAKITAKYLTTGLRFAIHF